MKISLSNYKAFNGDQTFDLRKFTLFTGANSTGKSTIKSWLNLLNKHRTTLITRRMIADFEAKEFDFGSMINKYSDNEVVSFTIYTDTNAGLAKAKYEFRLKKKDGNDLSIGGYGYLDRVEIYINQQLIFQILSKNKSNLDSLEGVLHLRNIVKILEFNNGPVFILKTDLNGDIHEGGPAIDSSKFSRLLSELKKTKRNKLSISPFKLKVALDQTFNEKLFSKSLHIRGFYVPYSEIVENQNDESGYLLTYFDEIISYLIGSILDINAVSITDDAGFLSDYDSKLFNLTSKSFVKSIKKIQAMILDF